MKRIAKISSPVVAVGIAVLLTTMCGACRPAAAQPNMPTSDANITRLTTGILEHSQLAHHAFDAELASKFLDRYVDSLDGTRSLFLLSDIDELAKYRATLAKATRDDGDTRPAQAIFDRYVTRLEEKTAFDTDALRTASFDFTGHDTYSYDREHAPRPKDLDEAKDLWRQQLRAEYLREKLHDATPSQIVSTLTRKYASQLRAMKSLRHDEVLDIYLEALTHVYDPHSDYLGHEEMESFSIAMNLSLFGIGATLENADGYCKIHDLVPGGPAARSGLLKPGDRIVAVAQAQNPGVDIVNMPLNRAVELIRGAKGSTVTLTVIPAGASDGSPTKSVAIVRDKVKLEDQEAKARIVDLPTDQGATTRVGVIELPSFYAGEGAHGRSATEDVARLLAKLKAEHVRGVVLDLRQNGGGSLFEAVSLTGLFIRTGPVVQTRDRSGSIDVEEDTDPAVQYDGPLVVLTSRFSASASEIVVGALQDYGRALVVGDSSTFGKGTVQSVIPLEQVMDRFHFAHASDPGALKVTISKFYRPSGASTQLRGVASDIVIPSTSGASDVSESALKDALPWDTIPSARYQALNRVAPYVDALREKSVARIKTDREFGHVDADVAEVKKALATKFVSLNEAERRAEMARSKADQENRARAAPALGDAVPPSYDITLSNASMSGLPPPARSAHAPAAATTNTTDERAMLRSDDAAILHESERILADYVELSAVPKQP